METESGQDHLEFEERFAGGIAGRDDGEEDGDENDEEAEGAADPGAGSSRRERGWRGGSEARSGRRARRMTAANI